MDKEYEYTEVQNIDNSLKLREAEVGDVENIDPTAPTPEVGDKFSEIPDSDINPTSN